VVNWYQIHFLDHSKVNVRLHLTFPYPPLPSLPFAQSRETYVAVVVGHLLSWWTYRIFYLVDLCLIKISILLFYNYVTSVHKSFHRIVKSLMSIVVMSSLGMIFAAVFSCTPPSDAWSFDVFWDGYLGIHSAKCYNPIILWYFSAGFNLLTDCIIWILPIPFVLNLQSMSHRRRIELAGIFSIGIVAITASAVRLWVVTAWASSFENQAVNANNLLIWTQVEQHAGIVAASIPFLRPIFRKLFRSNRDREQRASPSPAAKLIPPPRPLTPDGNPIPHRTPIIPSPSPTFGSSSAPTVPPSPLSPVMPAPENYDLRVAATV
jgi:hypothetical protein